MNYNFQMINFVQTQISSEPAYDSVAYVLQDLVKTRLSELEAEAEG